jgi:hypothetical protein
MKTSDVCQTLPSYVTDFHVLIAPGGKDASRSRPLEHGPMRNVYEGWTTDVQIPSGIFMGFCSLRHHCVQTGSGAHPASYPMGIGGKTAGSWGWHLTPTYAEVKNVCSYNSPRVVTGEKNSPTVAHACRKRRLKCVLPKVGVGAQG